jgi:hypothetical protein
MDGVYKSVVGAESYFVRKEGEHATICLHERTRHSAGGRSSYGGQLLIYSSFGSFGGSWNNCALPFKNFLCTLKFESLMGRIMNGSLNEYDGDGTFSEVKKYILSLRRTNEITLVGANELWACLHSERNMLERSVDGLVSAFGLMQTEQSTPAGIEFCDNPLGFAVERPNHAATRFWDQIWPTFKVRLKDEISHDELPETVMMPLG